jgi:hypothetical protein
MTIKVAGAGMDAWSETEASLRAHDAAGGAAAV